MRSRVRWILTASTFTLGIAIGIIASYYFGSWVDARYGTGSVFPRCWFWLLLWADFTTYIVMFLVS